MKKYKILIEVDISVRPDAVDSFKKEIHDNLRFVTEVGYEEDGRRLDKVVIKVQDVDTGKSIVDVLAAA